MDMGNGYGSSNWVPRFDGSYETYTNNLWSLLGQFWRIPQSVSGKNLIGNQLVDLAFSMNYPMKSSIVAWQHMYIYIYLYINIFPWYFTHTTIRLKIWIVPVRNMKTSTKHTGILSGITNSDGDVASLGHPGPGGRRPAFMYLRISLRTMERCWMYGIHMDIATRTYIHSSWTRFNI